MPRALVAGMTDAEPPTSTAQPSTDEVRNFVTELPHLAYSRGHLPAHPHPSSSRRPQLSNPPPSTSGHVMQQAVLSLPLI
ncbi:hypothetical protein ABBQ38_014606 [Trebouxia sp. C0009 RCD-2024]